MSQTFSIVCKEEKLKIWVGQGNEEMSTFHSGEPDTMKRLGRFLEATRGKRLILECDDYDLSEDCTEFEEDPPAASNRD